MPKIFVKSKLVFGNWAGPLNAMDTTPFYPDMMFTPTYSGLPESRHLYLVYQDSYGNERVIRGGPWNDDLFSYIANFGFGNIKTVVDADLLTSQDSPFDALGNFVDWPYAELDLQGRDPEEVWAGMTAYANIIGGNDIPYSAYSGAQNSNSTIAAVMHAMGFDLASHLPFGGPSDYPGMDNLLPGAFLENDDFYTPPWGIPDPAADNPSAALSDPLDELGKGLRSLGGWLGM